MGKGTAIALDSVQPFKEEQHVNSIKVSSAAIRIIRPRSQALPLAQRRLLLRRDSNTPSNPSNAVSNPNAAQVIVSQYFEK